MNSVLSLTSDAGDRFASLSVSDLSDAEQASLIRLALEVLEHHHRPGCRLENPAASRDYLRLLLGKRKTEAFGLVYLDGRHRVLAHEELFQGTLDGATVHPRIVVQRALEINAGAVIMFHNHPSGDAEPSQADTALTRRLKDALALVEIRVLDHVVVAATGAVSLADRGLL